MYFRKYLPLLVGVFLSGSPSSADVIQYEGICEASAAIRIDDEHFAVAGDELDTVAVYQFGVHKPIRWSEDLGKLSDIEAVAQIGDTTFWTTSHSLKKNGETKSKRNKLFATVSIDQQPVEVGKKYKELTSRLVTALAAHPSISLSEDGALKGLNIEGLAATADGELLIGLRAPLDDNGQAVVVNIGDPFHLLELAESDPASVQQPLKITSVDLGGKGIRSFARVPDSDQYLIVGGASKSEEAEFGLFKWNAQTGKTSTLPDDQLAVFDKASPEGMIIDPDGSIFLTGDNDKSICTDDEEDTRAKAFPSITLN